VLFGDGATVAGLTLNTIFVVVIFRVGLLATLGVLARTLAQLKKVAKKLPDTAIVIAVLRAHFLPSEKKLLKTFFRWCRRIDLDGEPTNPVVLLTSHELLFDHHISETWKSLGDPHAKFSNYENIRRLKGFADAT
jgi:hypothetical protein